MKNHIYVIAFLLFFIIPSVTFSQTSSNIANIVFPSESQISESQLKSLTASELKEIQSQIDLSDNSGCLYLVKVKIDDNVIEELLAGFKKYDISGDGVDDLIFSSPCAHEEMQNHFWVKKDKRYYHSGLIVGTLEKLYKANGMQALSIVSRSDWCCIPYVGTINLFIPEPSDSKLKYKLKKRVKEFVSITVPEKRIIEKKFPVINDKYDADASEFEQMAVYGNTLANFSKGSKGTAVVMTRSKAGRARAGPPNANNISGSGVSENIRYGTMRISNSMWNTYITIRSSTA